MQKITVTEPRDMLALIPFHLGFHPSSSVVVIGLRAKRVEMVARVDVVPDPSDAAGVAGDLARTMRREDLDTCLIVGYEEVAGESTPLSEALACAVAVNRLSLIDRLVVRNGRWSGLMCDCCRDQPVPMAADVGAVADFVALGRTALSSRDELAALVQSDGSASDQLAELVDRWVAVSAGGPDPGATAPAMPEDIELDQHAAWRRLCLSAWAALLDGGFDEELPDPWLALLLASVRDRALRDGLLAILCPGTLAKDALDPGLPELLDEYLSGWGKGLADEDAAGPWDDDGAPVTDDSSARVRSRLERLCRLAPDDHAAPILTVTATHAWWDGDGALARIAVERALELEPDHVLAGMLVRLLDLGVRGTARAA